MFEYIIFIIISAFIVGASVICSFDSRTRQSSVKITLGLILAALIFFFIKFYILSFAFLFISIAQLINLKLTSIKSHKKPENQDSQKENIENEATQSQESNSEKLENLEPQKFSLTNYVNSFFIKQKLKSLLFTSLLFTIIITQLIFYAPEKNDSLEPENSGLSITKDKNPQTMQSNDKPTEFELSNFILVWFSLLTIVLTLMFTVIIHKKNRNP